MLSYNTIALVVLEISRAQKWRQRNTNKEKEKEKDSDEIYGDPRLRGSPTRFEFVAETN